MNIAAVKIVFFHGLLQSSCCFLIQPLIHLSVTSVNIVAVETREPWKPGRDLITTLRLLFTPTKRIIFGSLLLLLYSVYCSVVCISVASVFFFLLVLYLVCVLLSRSTVVKVLCYKSEGHWFDPS